MSKQSINTEMYDFEYIKSGVRKYLYLSMFSLYIYIRGLYQGL